MRRVYKSSTILIDFDDERRVYGSVDEIPPEMRKRILSVFSGMQTGTIVIADRNGRKELARRAREQPAVVPAPTFLAPGNSDRRLFRLVYAVLLLLGTICACWLALSR